MVAALPVTHRLASSTPIPLERLAPERLVTLPRDANPAFHNAVVSMCRDAGPGSMPHERRSCRRAHRSPRRTGNCFRLRWNALGPGADLPPRLDRRGLCIRDPLAPAHPRAAGPPSSRRARRCGPVPRALDARSRQRQELHITVIEFEERGDAPGADRRKGPLTSSTFASGPAPGWGARPLGSWGEGMPSLSSSPCRARA